MSVRGGNAIKKKQQEAQAPPAQEPQKSPFAVRIAELYGIVGELRKTGYDGFVSIHGDRIILTVNRILSEEQQKLDAPRQQALLYSMDARPIMDVLNEEWWFDACYIQGPVLLAEFHKMLGDL